MRFLTIVSAIIFLAFACKDKTTSPLRKRKANKILLGSTKIDSTVWKLVKTYDPYNKGYTYWKDSSNYRHLALSSDGTFKEFDKENTGRGHWYLNKQQNKLAFTYQQRNGIQINESLQVISFRYLIDTIYEDTLVLSIQGRHGMVRQFYKLPENSRANDSTRVKQNILPTPDSVEIDSGGK